MWKRQGSMQSRRLDALTIAWLKSSSEVFKTLCDGRLLSTPETAKRMRRTQGGCFLGHACFSARGTQHFPQSLIILIVFRMARAGPEWLHEEQKEHCLGYKLSPIDGVYRFDGGVHCAHHRASRGRATHYQWHRNEGDTISSASRGVVRGGGSGGRQRSTQGDRSCHRPEGCHGRQLHIKTMPHCKCLRPPWGRGARQTGPIREGNSSDTARPDEISRFEKT
eukprot:1124102-Rhodomonas_salina.3